MDCNVRYDILKEINSLDLRYKYNELEVNDGFINSFIEMKNAKYPKNATIFIQC